VAAPSTQAATAMRILARTNARLAPRTLRRGKTRLNSRGGEPLHRFT
jgi:hypothetical protein